MSNWKLLAVDRIVADGESTPGTVLVWTTPMIEQQVERIVAEVEIHLSDLMS